MNAVTTAKPRYGRDAAESAESPADNQQIVEGEEPGASHGRCPPKVALDGVDLKLDRFTTPDPDDYGQGDKGHQGGQWIERKELEAQDPAESNRGDPCRQPSSATSKQQGVPGL